MRRLGLAIVFLAAFCSPALAQVEELRTFLEGQDGAFSARMMQLIALITVLSIAPGLLIMVTSFTRIVVVLSFLRSGLGLQSTPANPILISLALFMTFYVMGPTFENAWQRGLQPLMQNEINEAEAFTRIVKPFREFMRKQVRDKDLNLFTELAEIDVSQAKPEDEVELRILVPAFMISELRRGFEIGLLIILPFLVIDLIVATLTMSMGMMMLPPTVISLPFKVLFFILMDGWNLLVGSLVRSFV